MEFSAPTIPEELIRQLHDATDRLHAAREAMEQAMADGDYGHQHRIDLAQERFLQVDHELEEIDKAIRDRMA